MPATVSTLSRSSALLVSVRSGAEALEALAGGADLIDVKEPARGSLGRAEPAVLTQVLHAVAGRRPVSAALGELLEEQDPLLAELPTELVYVKWGLAGYADRPEKKGIVPLNQGDCRPFFRTGSAQEEARHALAESKRRLNLLLPHCGLVAVAYADWERARAPAPEDIAHWATTLHCPVLLVDTWKKDGTTLLDWLTTTQIAALIAHCRQSGLAIALAGSLGPTEILRLRSLRPTWFAVRGAACSAGQRLATVCRERVSELAGLLREPFESQSE